MKTDIEQPLMDVSKDGGASAVAVVSSAEAEAAERRGLIVSMITLVISIPALIGA